MAPRSAETTRRVPGGRCLGPTCPGLVIRPGVRGAEMQAWPGGRERVATAANGVLTRAEPILQLT
jgi:hypothetical protein